MRRLSKDAWIMISLLIVLLLVAMIAGGRQNRDRSQGFDPRRTSYSTAPAGLCGLYDTLDRLDYRVRRHIDNLTVQPEDGILFLISPDTPISEDEMKSLQAWVERGNTLVMNSGVVHDPSSLTEKSQVYKSTPAAPSFLAPDVRSFNVAGSNRIEGDELDFSEPLSCATGYG